MQHYNFKTPYAQERYVQYRNSLKSSFDRSRTDDILALHNKVMSDAMTTPDFDLDTYKLDAEGTIYTYNELAKMFNDHYQIVALQTIKIIEDYFDKNGTEPQTLFSRYKNGDGEARKAFTYIGIFPLIATNIWAEMRFPQHMMDAAKNPGSQIVKYINHSHNGETFQEIIATDYVIPPYEVGKVERMVADMWAQAEFKMNSQTLRIDKSDAEAPSPHSLN